MVLSAGPSPLEESPPPRQLSAAYQYHNAPEVAPAHGLENDDYSHPMSDKIPVLNDNERNFGRYTYHTRAPRILFGMKLKTFFWVTSFMVLIIVGAAVGGAVGGQNIKGEHNMRESDGHPTPQPSSESTNEPQIQPATDCPAVHNTPYVSPYADENPPAGAGLRFQKYCDVKDPLEAPETQMIGASFSSSFSDCVDTCAAINYWNRNRNCTVAVFQADAARPSNCWIGHVGSYNGDAFSRSLGRDVALLLIR